MNPFMKHGDPASPPACLAYSAVGDCGLPSPASLKLDVPCDFPWPIQYERKFCLSHQAGNFGAAQWVPPQLET